MAMVLAFSIRADGQQMTVLKNVNLIDGTGSPAQSNRTVVIAGDRIQAIAAGKTHVPSGANVGDMRFLG